MCHYLTVRSLLEAKEYNEALQVFAESEICTNMTQSGITFTDRIDIFQDAPRNVNMLISMRTYIYLYIYMYA